MDLKAREKEIREQLDQAQTNINKLEAHLGQAKENALQMLGALKELQLLQADEQPAMRLEKKAS